MTKFRVSLRDRVLLCIYAAITGWAVGLLGAGALTSIM